MVSRVNQSTNFLESTNDRVKFYSILNMLALVLSGVGQLFYLRQFFKSKKIL